MHVCATCVQTYKSPMEKYAQLITAKSCCPVSQVRRWTQGASHPEVGIFPANFNSPNISNGESPLACCFLPPSMHGIFLLAVCWLAGCECPVTFHQLPGHQSLSFLHHTAASLHYTVAIAQSCTATAAAAMARCLRLKGAAGWFAFSSSFLLSHSLRAS